MVCHEAAPGRSPVESGGVLGVVVRDGEGTNEELEEESELDGDGEDEQEE